MCQQSARTYEFPLEPKGILTNNNDFYQAMREKWRNEINSENEKVNATKTPVTQSKTTVSQSNAPSRKLTKRIEAQRAALDNEDYT